jgi:hypothetical protein
VLVESRSRSRQQNDSRNVPFERRSRPDSHDQVGRALSRLKQPTPTLTQLSLDDAVTRLEFLSASARFKIRISCTQLSSLCPKFVLLSSLPSSSLASFLAETTRRPFSFFPSLQQMGAKYSDKIQIDTTHFVCTTPAGTSSSSGGPGVEYQKALQLTLPVVEPGWILACQKERKMVPSMFAFAIPEMPLPLP